MKNRIICIVGPTASGKTGLSIELAKKINAEIISADSMQIYKGLDIGTGKVSKTEMQGIEHHMLDICDIKDNFSVADFKDMCYHEIDKIIKKGKNVIITGGTGLYFNAIVYDLQFNVQKINMEYRKQLNNILNEKGTRYLYDMLLEKDKDSANLIHPNNFKRIIRALEILKYSEESKSQHMLQEQKRLQNFKHPKYIFDIYCINYPREELYIKIEKRIDIMVKQGIIQEAKMIYDAKLNETSTCMQAIGYKEFFEYFKGDITLNEAINNLKKHTRHYAKRQMTWFNNKLKCKYLNDYKNIENMINYIVSDSKIEK